MLHSMLHTSVHKKSCKLSELTEARDFLDFMQALAQEKTPHITFFLHHSSTVLVQ
jgi:hypothetical protein